MVDLSEDELLNPTPGPSGGAIDTHVHFWKYDKKRDRWITDDMKLLRHDYLPEHVAINFKRNGVEGCVAVQVEQSELETYFLVELAKTHSIIKGVVGWVDLRSDGVDERLDEFSSYSIVKGFRHIAQAESNDFLLRQDFQKGVSALKKYGFTYDLLIYHHQMEAAAEFLNQLPDQKLVIDHCAKPDIKNKDINNWRLLIKEMAGHQNVYCKISGLLTEASWKNWSAADFYPYFDAVFEAFGPDRLMFGSDWPVLILSGIYIQWKSLIEKYMENFSQEDREKVFRLNAINFYHL
jgi:L-fuconolactonase